MKITWKSILIVAAIILFASVAFFIYATKISSSTITLLNPGEPGKDEIVNDNSDVRSKLTLILLKNDMVFGYYGDFIKGGKSVSLDETNNLITDGWKMFSKDSLVVVIKPTKEASYKATVNILDNMTINKIEKYSMVDLDKKEKEFLKIAE